MKKSKYGERKRENQKKNCTKQGFLQYIQRLFFSQDRPTGCVNLHNCSRINGVMHVYHKQKVWFKKPSQCIYSLKNSAFNKIMQISKLMIQGRGVQIWYDRSQKWRHRMPCKGGLGMVRDGAETGTGGHGYKRPSSDQLKKHRPGGGKSQF